MARNKSTTEEKVVNHELTAKALAKAIVDGDIVNFRLLFLAFSPARQFSTERFETSKYAYLLPDEETESSPKFQKALQAVKHPETWDHIMGELEANRPAQLPSELLVHLADNALEHEKFSSAAQAYELLRIRRRIQRLLFEEADRALEKGGIEKAVRGYRMGTGLGYDYAAFPEPLPSIPNYQTEALKLHAVYPLRPQDSVALRDEREHVTLAIEYLLHDAEAAGRLTPLSEDIRLAFVKELVRQVDPAWDEFAARYKEAVKAAKEYGERLRQQASGESQAPETLEDEIEEQMSDDPSAITSSLLGRMIPDGEWWQYMKELAYEHPAAILFVSRQAIGDREILIPRYRADSKLVPSLGLVDENAESGS